MSIYTEQELDDHAIIKKAREIIDRHLGQVDESLSCVGDALYWYLAHGDFRHGIERLEELDEELASQTD